MSEALKVCLNSFFAYSHIGNQPWPAVDPRAEKWEMGLSAMYRVATPLKGGDISIDLLVGSDVGGDGVETITCFCNHGRIALEQRLLLVETQKQTQDVELNASNYLIVKLLSPAELPNTGVVRNNGIHP